MYSIAEILLMFSRWCVRRFELFCRRLFVLRNDTQSRERIDIEVESEIVMTLLTEVQRLEHICQEKKQKDLKQKIRVRKRFSEGKGKKKKEGRAKES